MGETSGARGRENASCGDRERERGEDVRGINLRKGIRGWTISMEG